MALPLTPMDLSHPQVMQQVSRDAAAPEPRELRSPNQAVTQLMATPDGPQREVFGFVSAGVVADPGVGYPSWDFSMLTTVAYFGEHVNWNGNIVTSDTGWAVWNSSTATGLVNYAHSRGVKVVLTLILQDFGSTQPLMCSGLGDGQTTITQGIQQMEARGADGINLDYEGENAVCVNGQTSNSMLIGFVQKMRAAMPAGSYLSMDTYSGSAEGPDGFFNLPALEPYVDSFFVMAYDMEYYNWSGAPAYCTRMCLGPTAPLTNYFYNDTRSAAEYTATVPASKVIMGVPYYGRKACVAVGGPNDYPTSNVVADDYLDASAEQPYSDTVPGTYSSHRDVHDLLGQERFDDWLSASLNCTRQMYWDDFVSLGAKYDLVNRYNLRGVGIFTLNYGGGAPELWCDLRDHFSAGYVPATVTVGATQSTTEFAVTFTAGQGCGVSAFDLKEQDVTTNQPWVNLATAMAPTSYVNQAYSAGLTTGGYRGHTYQFQVRTHDGHGNIGAWSPPVVTTVGSTATLSNPFNGMYTLDAYGGVNPDGSATLNAPAYWPGWKIARAAHALPGRNTPQAGLVLDGYGALHPYGPGIETVNSPAYWQGWDIARDFAFLPDGSGGYVLDGYGGLHPFSVKRDISLGLRGGVTLGVTTMPPPVQGGPYWQGHDIARKVVIFPDGSGGYVLDGFGGVHSFGIGRPAPPAPHVTDYWPGWDIAHDFGLIPGTESGYVMDGYGGMHPFAPNGQPLPPSFSGGAYWSGWDIARGFWLLPSSTPSNPLGYLVDGYGGLHPLGPVPPVSPTPYWSGQDIARGIWGG
jgi:spore germination protein YaaH